MQVLSKVVAAGFVAALMVVAPVTPAAAQPVPVPNPAQDEAGPLQPVKVTVVIARYRGETRTSNLPYTLWVNANDESATNLRMNGSVPVPATTASQREGVMIPVTQVQYQPIGTQIDCRVRTMDGDRYRINLTVNDSSIAESPAGPDQTYTMPPRTVQFMSTNAVILRDGQTVEYTSAADKTTGEVVRLTVSIEVVR